MSNVLSTNLLHFKFNKKLINMLASQSSDVRILTEYRSPKLSEYISENMSYAAIYVSMFCQDACDVVGVHTKSSIC
jgi:hypothetical protein